MAVSWTLIGELCQCMRRLSEKSVAFAGKSQEEEISVTLVLTYWDVLVIYSRLSKTGTFTTRVFCSLKRR